MSEDELDLVLAPQWSQDTMSGGSPYWTAAQMQNAKPVPMPRVTVRQHQVMMKEVKKQQSATDTYKVPTSLPPRAKKKAATVSSSGRDTRLVQNRTAFPYSTCLKMFMSFGSSSMIGSAFIVGKRAVLTAGHCVFNHELGRVWASNIRYIPGYDNGHTPHGVFTPTMTTALREYVDGPQHQQLVFDIAASVVDRDFPDELLTSGYGVDHVLQPGKLRSIGYPGEARPGFNFNGNQMWTSLGDYHNEDDNPGPSGTAARNWGHFNDMTGGCSGGPIFTEGASPLLVGLNSHVLIDQQTGQPESPPRMFSPYFGQRVLALITWLENNGGGVVRETDEEEEEEDNGDLKVRLQAKVAELSDLIGELPG